MKRALRKTGGWMAAHPHLLMAGTLAAAAAVRLLLMTLRWINPDEGAHLLDGRLIWQGMQPVIDYASRQPLYAYVLALFIKIFGLSLTAGRLMPVLASLGIGWIICRMGSRLYDPLRGWLAATVFLFLPLTIIWSTVVKTEMLAILLSCLSAWYLLRALRESATVSYFILSGIMAALAYYVRQSTLYMPLAAALYLSFQGGQPFRSRARRLALFTAGYLGVCLLVAFYYWGPLDSKELLFSQINPFNLVWNRLAHTLGILPAQQRVVDTAGFRILDQDPAYTLSAWRDALLFSLFVIVAALWSLRKGNETRDPFRRFLWLWLVILLLAYAFQSASRGFYTQYFLEAMPALVLLGAGALPARTEPVERLKQILILALIYAALFAAFRFSWQFPLHWLVVITAGMGMALLAEGWLAWRGRKRMRIAPLLAYAAFFASAAWSGRLITPRYECVWSPRTLARVERILAAEGKRTDVVLSGGMVWTYAAGMQPYDKVSHPTLFMMKYDRDFASRFDANPPAFIILDGYTQKKFNRYWPFIESRLHEHYYRLESVTGSKGAVEVWRLQESPVAPEPELAERRGRDRHPGTGMYASRETVSPVWEIPPGWTFGEMSRGWERI